MSMMTMMMKKNEKDVFVRLSLWRHCLFPRWAVFTKKHQRRESSSIAISKNRQNTPSRAGCLLDIFEHRPVNKVTLGCAFAVQLNHFLFQTKVYSCPVSQILPHPYLGPDLVVNHCIANLQFVFQRLFQPRFFISNR